MAAPSRRPKSSQTVMNTKLGTKLSLVSSDITATPADYVVRFVDVSLEARTQESFAIAQAVGWQLVKEECEDFLEENGAIMKSEVFVGRGGSRWRNVLHVCIPGGTNSDIDDLITCIFNCLKEAVQCLIKEGAVREQPLNTIAFQNFPHLSILKCGKIYMAAVQKFDEEFTGCTNLNHIMIFESDTNRQKRLQDEMIQHPHMAEQEEPLRIVLVGKTGVGKSHTGNSILGQDFFVVEEQFASVTHKSLLGNVSRNCCDIEVVDTPGIFDSASPTEKTAQEKELVKSILFTLPGPHIFIVVFRGDDRFAEADANVLSKMEEVFSKDICRFLIVLFTHTKKQEKLDRLMKNIPDSMKDLLQRCYNRVLPIDNGDVGERPPECDKQVDAIIEMAKNLRKVNRRASEINPNLTVYYKNNVLDRCLQVINSTETTKTLDEIKEDIMHDDLFFVNSPLFGELSHLLTPLIVASRGLCAIL